MSVSYSGGIATVTQADGSQIPFEYYAPGATEPVGSDGVTWCPSDTTTGVFCPMAPRYVATLSGAPNGAGGPWTLVNDLGSPLTYSFTSAGVLDEIADIAQDTLISAPYSPGTGQAACPSGDTCTAWSSIPSGESTPSAVLVEAFNSSSELVSVFDAASGAASTQVATFKYTGTGCSTWTGTPKDLCSVTDPGSLKTTFTYDTTKASPYNYDEITMTPPNTGAVQNTYNSSGQVTTQIVTTGGTNQELQFVYGTSTAVTDGTQTTVTTLPNESSGSSTSATYLYSNNVQVGYEDNAGVWTYDYPDPATLNAGVSVDGNTNEGSQTLASYGLPGGTPVSTADVTSSTDAMGNTTLTAYTAANLPYCTVDAADALNGVTCPTTPPPAPPTTATGYTTTIYNTANQPISVTDPLGNTTVNAYTPSGDGVPVGLLYCTVDPVNVQANVTCPAYGFSKAGAATKTFDANGDVLTSTDPDGNTTTNVYGSAANPGLPTSTTDPDGSTTTYTYNAQGQVLTQTVSGASPNTYSATTQYAYNSVGLKWCEVDPYEYTAKGVRCPSSAPTSPPTTAKGYTDTIYNSNGQVTSTTNPLGGTTLYGYDGNGNQYCTVSPVNYAAGRSCPSLPLTTPTPTSDPYPGVTIDTFDPDNRVIQETSPIGGITLTTYDADGNPTVTTVESNNPTADPNVTTTTGYDADDRADSVTNASGTSSTEYDPNGNVYCSVSANAEAGGSSSYQCPQWEAGWITTPPSPNSEYSSTPSATQANNVTLSFYDANGDEVQSTNADVDTTVNAFDADGRTYCTIDPTNYANGATCPTSPPATPPATGSDPGYSTTIFDTAGRTLSTTNQLGDTTSTTYDPAGNKLTSTDPDGNVTTYCYYWETSTCASGAPTNGGVGGMLYSTTTPATAADPSGETTTSTYYPGGSVDVTSTPAGTTTSTQDAMGDPTNEAYTANSPYTAPTTLAFIYNVDQTKAKMTDGTGSTAYAYDAAGDLTQQAFTAKSGTKLANQTLGYSYFSTGQTQSVIYPTYGSTTSPTATYTYNTTGQMASVTDWASTPNEVTFSYDADGNETAQNNEATSSDPSGTSDMASTYDAADEEASSGVTFGGAAASGINPEVQGAPAEGGSSTAQRSLAEQLGVPVAETSGGSSPSAAGVSPASSCTPTTDNLYFAMEGGSASEGTRNPDGQITQDAMVFYDNCGDGIGGFVRFGYDQAGDVICVPSSCSGGYTYDPAGHLTETTNGATNYMYTQTVDADGETTSQMPAPQSPGVASTFTYDTLGDLTSDVSTTTTTYSYNQLGQMTKMTNPSGSTAYLYNGDGLETSVKPSTATNPTQLLWGETGSLPLLLSDGNDYFVYGPGQTPVEQMNITSAPPSSNPTFINFLPGTGYSYYLITNTSGLYTNATSYDPFGNLMSGSPGTVFGFAGQYADTSSNSSGFDNMRARWYNPGTGNFTTVDPDLATTGQPYEYAGDDPVNRTDPSGQFVGEGVLKTVETGLEDVGEGVAEGAGEVVAGAVTIVVVSVAVATAAAVAWSAATATPAGGNADIPIWFGQARISSSFGNGSSIAGPPSGVPIPVFPVEVAGKPIAVAEGNRRLANYSLNGVTYPPYVWVSPSETDLARLKETSALGDPLPSPRILVTPNIGCTTPSNVPGSANGVVTSVSFIQMDA